MANVAQQIAGRIALRVIEELRIVNVARRQRRRRGAIGLARVVAFEMRERVATADIQAAHRAPVELHLRRVVSALDRVVVIHQNREIVHCAVRSGDLSRGLRDRDRIEVVPLAVDEIDFHER